MGQILSSSPNLGGRTTADSILRRSRKREDKKDKDGGQAGTDVRGFLGADRQCEEPRPLRDQGRGDLVEGQQQQEENTSVMQTLTEEELRNVEKAAEKMNDREDWILTRSLFSILNAFKIFCVLF